jgi:uncharacterized protein YndB with AHSA1/START domain
MTGLVAVAEIDVNAPRARVWAALTEPDQIKRYMFGSEVVTDWKPGSDIVWRGEYDGKAFEDKGEVVEVDAQRRLKVTHFSPLSGQPDEPENYHTLTYELSEAGSSTHVTLSQDNNADAEEAKHSKENWSMMLKGLKQVVEDKQ